MEYLAIKSENGKGVYICNNKKEKNKIVVMYPGCSNRSFKESQKDAALEWAGVNGIANVPQVSVPVAEKQNKKGSSSSAQKHNVLQTLELLASKGYTHAEIKLNDGSSFVIFIRDGKFVADIEDLLPSFELRNYSSGIEIQRGHNKYGYTAYLGFSNPNHRSNKDMTFNILNDKFRECCKPDLISIENTLRLLLKTIAKVSTDRYSYEKFNYYKFFKTKIDVIGNIAIFEHVLPNGIKQNSTSRSFEETECYYNYSVNMDLIMSIRPLKLSNVIDDDMWNKVIDEVEKDGYSFELPHWQP